MKKPEKHYRLVLQINFGDGIYKEWDKIDIPTTKMSFWDQLKEWIKNRPKGTSPAEYKTLDGFM